VSLNNEFNQLKRKRDMQKLIKKLEEERGKPISEFNKGDWYNISVHQKLTEQFIREYQNLVDWEMIFKYQNLSEDFKQEFQHKIKSI
jgi:hypothetical protein